MNERPMHGMDFSIERVVGQSVKISTGKSMNDSMVLSVRQSVSSVYVGPVWASLKASLTDSVGYSIRVGMLARGSL